MGRVVLLTPDTCAVASGAVLVGQADPGGEEENNYLPVPCLCASGSPVGECYFLFLPKSAFGDPLEVFCSVGTLSCSSLNSSRNMLNLSWKPSRFLSP